MPATADVYATISPASNGTDIHLTIAHSTYGWTWTCHRCDTGVGRLAPIGSYISRAAGAEKLAAIHARTKH